MHETTRPCQPIPPKRVPRRSRFLDDNEYLSDPRLRALFQSRQKKPAYTPIPQLDESLFETFKAILEDDPDQYVISYLYLYSLFIYVFFYSFLYVSFISHLLHCSTLVRYFTICTRHKLCNRHFLDIAAKGTWLTTEVTDCSPYHLGYHGLF